MQFGFSSSEIKIKELVQEYMTKNKIKTPFKNGLPRKNG